MSGYRRNETVNKDFVSVSVSLIATVMKKQSQLLRQSRFQLHRRRLATSWKHVALYTSVYDTMYIHTGCRTRRYAVTVGWISTSRMRRGMRRRERITNVSLLPSSFLPPSFLPLPFPFPFSSDIALSRSREAPYTHPEILFTWKF